jgi:thioredoxin 1
MTWLTILLLIATALLILMPLRTYLAARRQIGHPIESQAPGGGEGDRMIYFFSPRCGPCRNMTPIIDRLSEQNPQVFKVDVLQDHETARAFSIRATPTTILVKDNRVLAVSLGAKSRRQLETLLRRVA